MGHLSFDVNTPTHPEYERFVKPWAGGEDYILLFAVRATDPSAFEDEYLRAFGSRPARIGQLKDRAFGTKLTQEGREFQSRLTPFEHF